MPSREAARSRRNCFPIVKWLKNEHVDISIDIFYNEEKLVGMSLNEKTKGRIANSKQLFPLCVASWTQGNSYLQGREIPLGDSSLTIYPYIPSGQAQRLA